MMVSVLSVVHWVTMALPFSPVLVLLMTVIVAFIVMRIAARLIEILPG